ESLVIPTHHFLFAATLANLPWNAHSLPLHSFLFYHYIANNHRKPTTIRASQGGHQSHGDRTRLAQTPFVDRRVRPVYQRCLGAEPDRAALYRRSPCRALVHPYLGRAGSRVVSTGAHHGRAWRALPVGWRGCHVYRPRPRAVDRLAHRSAVSRGDCGGRAGDGACL